jgi:hypothetical protein
MMALQKEKPEGLEFVEKSLTSLKKARDQIENISTWPWRIETLRQIVAAIFLPFLSGYYSTSWLKFWEGSAHQLAHSCSIPGHGASDHGPNVAADVCNKTGPDEVTLKGRISN